MKAWRLNLARLLFSAAALVRGLAGLLAGIGSGVIDLESAAALSEGSWDELPDFRSKDLVASGLRPIERRFSAHLAPGGRLLVLGCGGGRDSLGFARLGFKPDGIDISPRAVELARRSAAAAGIEARFRLGGVAGTEFSETRYNGVIFSWCLYAALAGSRRRVEALAAARRRLSGPQGSVVLTFIARTGDEPPSRRERLAAVVGRLTRNPSPLEPGDRIIEAYNLLVDHRFTRAEVEDEAAKAGFAVAVYGAPEDFFDHETFAVLRPRPDGPGN